MFVNKQWNESIFFVKQCKYHHLYHRSIKISKKSNKKKPKKKQNTSEKSLISHNRVLPCNGWCIHHFRYLYTNNFQRKVMYSEYFIMCLNSIFQFLISLLAPKYTYMFVYFLYFFFYILIYIYINIPLNPIFKQWYHIIVPIIYII